MYIVFGWYVEAYLKAALVLLVTVMINLIVLKAKYNHARYPRDVYDRIQNVINEFCERCSKVGFWKLLGICIASEIIWPVTMPYWAYRINYKLLECIHEARMNEERA